MNFISQVTIVTAQGVKSYHVGDLVDRKKIHTIEQRPLYFQGDPFDHYVGLSEDGEMLFSVNCNIPCDVTYIPK